MSDLAAKGIAAEQPEPPGGGADGSQTNWITDPDGHRIVLVQWPTGRADSVTKTDFDWTAEPARLACTPTPAVIDRPMPSGVCQARHGRPASCNSHAWLQQRWSAGREAE